MPQMAWRFHDKCRASGRSREKKSNFAGFSGTNSRKKRPISREFRGNFRGQFRWKTIGKERPISWELPEQISLESDFALIWGKFSKKLDALIAFTQASYRNMKSYFTSKLIEHNKNKQKNQDIKNTFTILVASSSVFFIQLHVVHLTFKILFTTILHFFNIWGTLVSSIVWFSSR